MITPFQIDDLYTEEKGWRTEEEEERGEGETPEPERSSGCARGALRVTCNSTRCALCVTCDCVHEDFDGVGAERGFASVLEFQNFNACES